MSEHWISERSRHIDASGIRKVFELAGSMKNPVNLSIGQPHFDVPAPVKEALIRAVRDGKNDYSLTQGIPPLVERLQRGIDAELGQRDRKVMVTSGSSGALTLVLLALLNPGDEVIVFDPWYVMYEKLIKLAEGKMVTVDTYPDFRPDLDKVRRAFTSRTNTAPPGGPPRPLR